MKKIILFLLTVIFINNRLFSQVSISSLTPTCIAPDTAYLNGVFTGFVPSPTGLDVDDGFSCFAIPLGFTFSFYGVNYTSCVVGGNGTIDFQISDSCAYEEWDIPDATPPTLPGNPNCNSQIMGCYSDIYTPAGGEVTYATIGSAPNRIFVVTFCSVPMYEPDICPDDSVTFQMMCYETSNNIEVHITNKQVCTAWNSGEAIQGIQDPTGTLAVTTPGRNATQWTAYHDAVRFTPMSPTVTTTYTESSIPYAPLAYAYSTIYWYANGVLIDSGNAIGVTPTVTTTYTATAYGCNDTVTNTLTIYSIATYDSALYHPEITNITGINPTVCGFCNGTVSLYGIPPHLADTIFYSINGVDQPSFIDSSGSDSVLTITGLCAGIYNYYYKSNSCPSNTVTTTLTNPPISISGFTSTPPDVCGAADATITLYGLYPGASDTINYELGATPQPVFIATVSTAGTVTITGLIAGTYNNITATMSTCTSPAVGPVTIDNPPLVISGTSSTIANCATNNGTITLYGLPAGQTVTVNFDFNGVAQTPVVLTSTAGGTVTFTGLAIGTYSNITATINTCTSAGVGPITIVQPPIIPITFVSSVNPTECGKCDGEIVVYGVPPFGIDSLFYAVTPTGSATSSDMGPVLVSSGPDSSVTLLGLCQGSYDSITFFVGTCPTSIITTPVTLVAPPMASSFDTVIHRGCNGDTVFFVNESTPPAGLLYSWQFGDGTSDTSTNPEHIYLEQGIYTPTLITTNGYCVATDTFSLSLVHPLQVAFTSSDSIVCQGTPITFTNASSGTLPISYQWYLGDGTTSNAASVTYTYNIAGSYNVMLVGTNFIPCSDTAYKTIYSDSLSAISISLTDSAVCAGNAITFSGYFSGIGNSGVSWNFGNGDSIAGLNPVTYAYPAAGNFIVTLTSKYRACASAVVTQNVSVFRIPVIDLGADTSLCPGSDAITFTDSNNISNPVATWLWNTGQTTPYITVNTPGSYSATVYINGCNATDSVLVQNNCYIELPNVFTPNNDGINDYFSPTQFMTKGLVSFKMDIYDRWGQLVFEGTSLDGRGWDGKLNNIEQPNGVYIYNIDAAFIDGRKEHHQGNVTLLR